MKDINREFVELVFEKCMAGAAAPAEFRFETFQLSCDACGWNPEAEFLAAVDAVSSRDGFDSPSSPESTVVHGLLRARKMYRRWKDAGRC